MRISDTRLKNFRQVLAEKKLRLTEIAELLGKAPAQISAFGGKNPTKGIGDQIAREIERALSLPLGYLDHHSSGGGTDAPKLPVLTPFQAAEWCHAGEHKPEAELWLVPPSPTGSNGFVLKIDGLSMEPEFVSGEMVVVDPSRAVEPGDYVAVYNSRTKAVVLRQLKQEGGVHYLYSLNPDWPERLTELTDEWKICGRVNYRITQF